MIEAYRRARALREFALFQRQPLFQQALSNPASIDEATWQLLAEKCGEVFDATGRRDAADKLRMIADLTAHPEARRAFALVAKEFEVDK